MQIGWGSSTIRSLTWPTTKNFNKPKVYRGKRRNSIPSTQLMRWVVGARFNLTLSNDHHALESIRPCQTPAPRAPLGGPLPFFAPSEHTIEFGKYATLINSKLRRSRWGSSIGICLPNTCTALRCVFPSQHITGRSVDHAAGGHLTCRPIIESVA